MDSVQVNPEHMSDKKHRTRRPHDPLRHLIQSSNGHCALKYPIRHLSDLMYIERYENGGGYALHAYADELSRLNKEDLNMFAKKFLNTLFTERRKRGIPVPFSNYCIGVVHGAGQRFPELLAYLSQTYPSLMVNTNPLEQKNATQAISLSEFAKNVYKSYNRGTYGFGPMHAISIVGVKGEERGHFSQDIINMIESDPFLCLVTPWGSLSSLCGMDPHKSDDGPIVWVRPGEQSIPVCPSAPKKQRLLQDADLISLLSNRRVRRIRQVLVTDRTPCHADHADDGLGRHTTAAIGLLKAIFPMDSSHHTMSTSQLACFEPVDEDSGEPWRNPYTSTPQSVGRIIKDVVVFDPRHYPDLVKRLRLDIMEPPASQCGSFWADDGELNELHSEGYSYVRLPLRENDIYFIPRNVVHQFKTISAGTSVAWHVRLKQYYDEPNSAPVISSNQEAACSTSEVHIVPEQNLTCEENLLAVDAPEQSQSSSAQNGLLEEVGEQTEAKLSPISEP